MSVVSIIIPCHNSLATLDRTLRSVREQTFTDWRIIAIDDRSTDDTREHLRACTVEDPRIRLIDGRGRGASAARNLGMSHAKGDMIAFLDSDDIWEPDRLAVFHRYFTERPEIDIAYSRYAFFTREPGDNLTTSTVPPRPLSVLDLLHENPVGTMSNLVMRRHVMNRVGNFRDDITHGEDREWLVRAVARGCMIGGLDRTLLHYRTSMNGLSSDLGKMYDGWKHSVHTASTLGALPHRHAVRSAEAVYLRYLSRRAMRLGLSPRISAAYALRGAFHSPSGFFSGGKRGPLTLGSAIASLIAPRTMRNTLSKR